MRQSATDNVLCIGCGSDVRRDALFCYNCGAAVIEPHAEASSQPEIIEPEIAQERTDETLETAEMPAEQAIGNDKAAPAKKQPRKPLTAAMLRRKKASNRVPVEVEWQPPESSSNLFLFASIFLTAVAVAIIAIALYLK